MLLGRDDAFIKSELQDTADYQSLHGFAHCTGEANEPVVASHDKCYVISYVSKNI